MTTTSRPYVARGWRLIAVAYTAVINGEVTRGIAEVPTTRMRPAWEQCALAIPGYHTGRTLTVDELHARALAEYAAHRQAAQDRGI